MKDRLERLGRILGAVSNKLENCNLAHLQVFGDLSWSLKDSDDNDVTHKVGLSKVGTYLTDDTIAKLEVKLKITPKPKAESKPETQGYVSVAPTWQGLVPLLVEVAANGVTPKGRQEAMDELLRLAKIVDEQIAARKNNA